MKVFLFDGHMSEYGKLQDKINELLDEYNENSYTVRTAMTFSDAYNKVFISVTINRK
jgi:hypothetical protein